MTNKTYLMKQATNAAKHHGHKLSYFHHHDRFSASAICQQCGARVDINTNPDPNEIDIGGEAVSIGCNFTK